MNLEHWSQDVRLHLHVYSMSRVRICVVGHLDCVTSYWTMVMKVS